VNEALEPRIKRVIVDALMLEDVKPEEIDTDAPLFVEGLGLDSIDALELALAIHKEFGVKTTANDERNREYFYSVASLAKFITEQQAKTEAGEDPEASASEPAAAEAAGEATRPDTAVGEG
jgi:acyl carrier protein